MITGRSFCGFHHNVMLLEEGAEFVKVNPAGEKSTYSVRIEPFYLTVASLNLT